MNEVIKIGLIGCGRISKNHFEVIKNHPNLELVAVCDSVQERADEKAKEFGVKAYTDEDAFSQHEMDLVSVCTPSGLHPQHGIKAVSAGKHVVTEKPMSVSMQGAKDLIAAANEHKKRLFVVKQNRLNESIKMLKKAIEKNRFKKIYMVNSNVYWTRPQEYYDMAGWRGTWALDGGAYMNQASHYVDLMQWLFGDIESVFAKTKTFARKIEAEDSGVTLFNYKNGTLGTMQVSMLTYPKNYEGSITVIGEEGTVKIGGTSLNKIEKWDFKHYDDDDAKIGYADSNPPNVYGFGHYDYYNSVVETLLGDKAPMTDGEEGLKSLRLLNAIYASSREGKEVFLDDL